MSVRRVMFVVAIVLYSFLWVIAANGASGLVAPLVIPVVLAVLVAGGVALDRFMGITPHRPKFDDRDREKES